MAKKLSEIYAPKSKDGKAFVAKHGLKKTTDKSPATKDDARFKATNIKTFDRSAKRMGYNPGEDEKAYGTGPEHPGPNDQIKVTAIAPYTIKTNEEDDIEEGNYVSKAKKDEYVKQIGKDKEGKVQMSDTKAKRAGRAELRKEDVLDEVSKKLAASYLKKAAPEKEALDRTVTGGYPGERDFLDDKTLTKYERKFDNRTVGVKRAKKITKEDIEINDDNVDELIALIDEYLLKDEK